MIINDYMVKPVEVCTLKEGDKFVLHSDTEKLGNDPYVYVVTDVYWSGVDVVCINSGKVFTFGRAVPVVPVMVTMSICPTKEVIEYDLRYKGKT